MHLHKMVTSYISVQHKEMNCDHSVTRQY